MIDNVTPEHERVGDDFALDRLLHARRVGWRVLREVAAAVRPGHGTADVKRLLDAALHDAGIKKQWHPAQLRLGKNTLCPFGEPALSDAPLGARDIFFLDMGLLVDGYEADCAETFVMGDDADMQRCAADAKAIHALGVAHWQATRCTGAELYRFTEAQAALRGWVLSRLEADGHRLGDFPHHRFSKAHLIECEFTPASDRWVYEVQLRDPEERFGAFYEDLLTSS